MGIVQVEGRAVTMARASRDSMGATSPSMLNTDSVTSHFMFMVAACNNAVARVRIEMWVAAMMGAACKHTIDQRRVIEPVMQD